jgi:hypothetical protein
MPELLDMLSLCEKQTGFYQQMKQNKSIDQ